MFHLCSNIYGVISICHGNTYQHNNIYISNFVFTWSNFCNTQCCMSVIFGGRFYLVYNRQSGVNDLSTISAVESVERLECQVENIRRPWFSERRRGVQKRELQRIKRASEKERDLEIVRESPVRQSSKSTWLVWCRRDGRLPACTLSRG